MEQHHASDLPKRLEQLGIEAVVSPTVPTLTYEKIYISGSTLEEALATLLGRGVEQVRGLAHMESDFELVGQA